MLKNTLNDFKKFAVKGNVLDMAVGIIIGAAFGKIVDSMVKDVIMPPIGLLMGKVDFTNLFVTIMDGKVPGPYNTLAQAQTAGAITINIGLFLNTIISFLIVAFAVFMLVKGVNKLKERMDRQEAKAAPTTKKCPYCCSAVDINATKCPYCTSSLK